MLARTRKATLVLVLALTLVGAGVILSCPLRAAPPQRLDEVLRRWRAGGWTPESYHTLEYGAAGDAANWLSDHGGRGVTVSYVNQTFFAPLFGWHNENRVVYATTPDDIYPGRAPRMASYAEWRAFLERERVDLVVEWVPWWGESRRDPMAVWIAEHPGDFRLERDFGRMRVWRPVLPSDAPLATIPR